MSALTYEQFAAHAASKLMDLGCTCSIDLIDPHRPSNLYKVKIKIKFISNLELSMDLNEYSSNRIAIDAIDSFNNRQVFHTDLTTEGLKQFINKVDDWNRVNTKADLETPNPHVFINGFANRQVIAVSSVEPAIICNSLVKLVKNHIDDLEHALAFLLSINIVGDLRTVNDNNDNDGWYWQPTSFYFILVRDNYYWSINRFKSLDGSIYIIADKSLNLYQSDKSVIDNAIKSYVNVDCNA